MPDAPNDLAVTPRPDADRPNADLRRVGSHPDHWYPLAWSREVKPGSAIGVRFAGEPIVIARAKSGRVFALEDRCAHRQVPLSAGVVDGEALRCCYHGWTYDCAGKCIDVPYLGKGKLPNGVRAYPCHEEAGVILVFPGCPEQAARTPPPTLGAASDPAYKTRRFGGEVACHYSFMHENLMDMNHQFLHRKQMGQIRPHYRGRRVGESWLEVDYTFARTAGKRSLGESAIFGNSEGRKKADGSLMTIRTEYPYQILRIWAGDEQPVMHLWICYVPPDREQRRNRTFGLLSVRRPGIPLLLDIGWPALIWFTNRIFAEDRWIVEREQEAHDAQGSNWNQEVFPVIRELGGLLGRCGVAPSLVADPIDA